MFCPSRPPNHPSSKYMVKIALQALLTFQSTRRKPVHACLRADYIVFRRVFSLKNGFSELVRVGDVCGRNYIETARKMMIKCDISEVKLCTLLFACCGAACRLPRGRGRGRLRQERPKSLLMAARRPLSQARQTPGKAAGNGRPGRHAKHDDLCAGKQHKTTAAASMQTRQMTGRTEERGRGHKTLAGVTETRKQLYGVARKERGAATAARK